MMASSATARAARAGRWRIAALATLASLAVLASALPIARALATTITPPLSFETTLVGSEGANRDCIATLAVSESAHRLFALDACNGQVAIYDTLTLANLGTVPVERAGAGPLMLAVGHHGSGTGFDDHVFISDATGLHVSDAATLAPVADVAGALGPTCLGSSDVCAGFDDGVHMVVDTAGQRIFVTNHNFPLNIFDFALNPLAGSSFLDASLTEPLGIAAHPDGTLFVTDEEDASGLFRLNPDLSLDAQIPVPRFTGAEGVAVAADSGLVFAADEDRGLVDIFNAATLDWIGSVNVNAFSDGPYWLGVDEGANRLFLLADTRVPDFASGMFGVHVYIGVNPVPEPASLALFAAGLAGLGFLRRRRRTA